MTLLTALVVLQTPYITRPEQFLTFARSAVGSGVESRVGDLFQNRSDADYLFTMARDRGGLRTIKFSMIPAPPGWEDTAPYWGVFHTRQDIEQDHDPVYPILRTNKGFQFGKEMPEWAGIETRIKHIRADVRLAPAQNKASIKALVTFDGKKTSRAPILRLQDLYKVTSGKVKVADESLVQPQADDIVRAGSLIIPWTKTAPKDLALEYEGVVNSQNEDKINPRQAYLTAWWLPSVGRLPHTTEVRITGPKDWVLKSEGPEVSPETQGPYDPLEADQQIKAFKCDLPISYPKVIGGAYQLAAQAKVGGKDFRAYHLGQAEKDRGDREVQAIANAVAFFEKTLGTFPFDHYYGFDATGYYGIESYSHTLLAKGITLQFMSHEIAHTYFGGIVPCAYVKDTWNESLTQYIDSIVYLNNADRTLEAGLRTMNVDVPLSKMNVAHAHDSATYYRGAYVIKMLEDEIGRDKVLDAMRVMVNERVGQDTTWPDLLPYFEKSGGQKLDWFWNQWIYNAKFPTLTVEDAEPVSIEGKWRTRITVAQSGTPELYRLRFKVVARRGPQKAEQVVTMKAPGETFTVNTDFQPSSVEVEAFPYTLARVVKK